MKNIVQILRISQSVTSIILFISVFILCITQVDLDIREIQLSNWGIHPVFGTLWNIVTSITAISILINVKLFFKYHIRLKYISVFNYLFTLASICLVGLSVITMPSIIHNAFAYIYFGLYPLAIFLFAFCNRKYMQYNEWMIHTVISVCMIIIPIAILQAVQFPGFAVAEIAHTVCVIVWNSWLLTSNKAK